MDSPRRGVGRPAGAALLIGAALAVGRSVMIHQGAFYPAALAWLGAGILACAASIAWSSQRRTDRLTRFALPVALLVQFALLMQVVQYMGLEEASRWPYGLFLCGAILAAACVGGLLAPQRSLNIAGFAGLCALHAIVAVWTIRHLPTNIDVWRFQTSAAQALLAGNNPYTQRLPDLYSPQASATFYGPGISSGGQLTVGFPYPPLSLFLVLPGYALGDVRYADLAAMVLAAILMSLAGGGRAALWAAAILLLTPRTFFVLGFSWTEPLVVMLLAATVWCAMRRPSWLPWALGLFLASKQYTLLVLPAAVLLLGPGWRWRDYVRLLVKAGLVALLVSAPLALWAPRAFVHDVIEFQFRQPFRADSLSFLTIVANADSPWFMPVALLLAAMATALGLWKAPRSPAGFAATAALTWLLFFAFSKQAFVNYYFLVIGALCCAAAASFGDRCKPAAAPLSH